MKNCVFVRAWFWSLPAEINFYTRSHKIEAVLQRIEFIDGAFRHGPPPRRYAPSDSGSHRCVPQDVERDGNLACRFHPSRRKLAAHARMGLWGESTARIWQLCLR